MRCLEMTLDEITNVGEQNELPGLLDRIAERYGMKTAAYLGTGTLDRQTPVPEPYAVVTYPMTWVERYRAQGYLQIDPVIQTGLRRLLPIDWDDLDYSENPALRQFFGEAAEFGLGHRGISFPIHGVAGDRALFSVTADLSAREWSWARRAALRHLPIIATHFHEVVVRTQGVLRAQPRLSPRELECLQWKAEGKTAWECAIILGLSEHTVRCYLESARHKLGASSTTQAVAIAEKSGLLFRLP